MSEPPPPGRRHHVGRDTILWVKQRIQFGGAESLGRIAVRGAIGGKTSFITPRFGRCCICCNADAMGRTQDYDPSNDRVTAPAVPMPVCSECQGHAMQTSFVPTLQVCLLFVGLSSAGLAGKYITERPDDPLLWAAVIAGLAMFGAAVLWLVATSRRNRREQVAGHHPRLVFSVGHGRTLLDTTNEELVRELLELNPSARVLPEPPLWRWQRRRQMPSARVVRSRTL